MSRIRILEVMHFAPPDDVYLGSSPVEHQIPRWTDYLVHFLHCLTKTKLQDFDSAILPRPDFVFVHDLLIHDLIFVAPCPVIVLGGWSFDHVHSACATQKSMTSSSSVSMVIRCCRPGEYSPSALSSSIIVIIKYFVFVWCWSGLFFSAAAIYAPFLSTSIFFLWHCNLS